MNIGQRIKARRKQLGLSADQVGAIIGKNRATVFRYEKGDIENLPLDILGPLSTALRTTPAYIMGWEEIDKKNDIISDVVVKLRTDDEFLAVVEQLYGLNSEKLKGVRTMLSAFLK